MQGFKNDRQSGFYRFCRKRQCNPRLSVGFVREQVEEEATAQGIVDKLKKAGDTGLLFIDAQLAKR